MGVIDSTADAVKPDAHASEGTASKLAHEALDLAKAAVHAAGDTASAAAKTVTDTASSAWTALESTASSAFGGLKTTLAHAGLMSGGTDPKVSESIGQLNKTLDRFGDFKSFTKQDDRTFISADKRLSLTISDKSSDCQNSDSAWALLDAHESGGVCRANGNFDMKSLDLSTNELFKGKQGAVTPDQANAHSVEFINQANERAILTKGNGEVHYQSFGQDGKPRKEAIQTAQTAQVIDGETKATLDKLRNQFHLTDGQIQVIQSREGATVIAPDGVRLQRLNGEVKAYLPYDGGETPVTVGKLGITIGNFAIYEDLSKVVSQIDGSAHQDGYYDKSTGILHISGEDPRYFIEKRQDGKIRIHDGVNGQDWFLDEKTGKLCSLQNGQFIEVYHGTNIHTDPDGKLHVGEVTIDQHAATVSTGRGSYNWREQTAEIAGDHDQPPTRIQLTRDGQGLAPGESPNGIKLQQGGNTFTTQADEPGVQIQTQGGQTYTALPGANPRIDSKRVSIGTNEIILHKPDGRDIRIDRYNNVDFGDGVRMQGDGSIYLNGTEISSTGFIRSPGWSSSDGLYLNDPSRREFHLREMSATMAAAAEAVSYNAQQAAASAFAKAMSGAITSADLTALSGSASDVGGLLAQLSSHGNSPLVAELERVLKSLQDAISFATPRIKAAELASERGVPATATV